MRNIFGGSHTEHGWECSYMYMVIVFIPGLHHQVFESAGISGDSFFYCLSEKLKNEKLTGRC